MRPARQPWQRRVAEVEPRTPTAHGAAITLVKKRTHSSAFLTAIHAAVSHFDESDISESRHTKNAHSQPYLFGLALY